MRRCMGAGEGRGGGGGGVRCSTCRTTDAAENPHDMQSVIPGDDESLGLCLIINLTE